MNLYQTVQQIRYRLSLASWPGTSNKAFAKESIIVTVGPDSHAMWQRRFPIVLVRPGSSTADPIADEDPRFLQQTINLRLVQMVPGDDVGEMCLLGAHQPEITPADPLTATTDIPYDETKTTSSGKGLLQIEEVLIDSLQSMGPDEGIFMLCRFRGGVEAVLAEEMGYVCWRDYQFDCQITAERTFAPGINLKVSGDNLVWSNPATRYDFLKMVLIKKAGSTPPTSITDGTAVTLGSSTATSVASPGTAAYSLFAVYDDYHDTPEDTKDISPAETLVVA